MNATLEPEIKTGAISETHSWLDRPLIRLLTPAVLILLSIMLLSTALHFINLESIGDANTYYTAAVKSMLQSWHNFFFVAAEPGGSVTVDKPPLGLWIEAAFAAVLGVSGFSVSLPNILAGIFGIPLLYHLVRKYLGTLAGLLAALVFAITPVVLATDRNNTMDGMLVFFLLLAAWAFIKATETGKFSWLAIGAVLVGLGFNIKMLQAFLPLPAFYALYLLGSRSSWWRKIGYLCAATVILLIVSLSWAVAVDLTPSDQRPYIGSSTDNTVMELIIGHNGLERLLGRNAYMRGAQAGSAPDAFMPDDAGNFPTLPPGDASNRPTMPTGDGGADRPQNLPGLSGQDGFPAGAMGGTQFGNEIGSPSILRLFSEPLAVQMSWLLPFALAAIVLIALSAKVHFPMENKHKALLLWGGWLLTCLIFFSIAGFFHAYYMIMLAPALGAVVGGGIQILIEKRENPWMGWLLAVFAAVTLAFQWWLATRYDVTTWWLFLAVGLLALGAVLLLLSKRTLFLTRSFAYSLMVSGILVAPLAWSIITVIDQSPDMNLPTAYRGTSSPMGGQPDGNRNRTDTALLDFLEANTQDVTYLVAVANANTGAPLVLATGRPVLYMGGFTGSDSVVDAADLQTMVADGDLRYILISGGNNADQGISTWLQSSCAIVSGFSQSVSTDQRNGPGGNVTTLYNCDPSAETVSDGSPSASTPPTTSTPPQVAVAACVGLAESASCAFVAPNGKLTRGICASVHQFLACVPSGMLPPAP